MERVKHILSDGSSSSVRVQTTYGIVGAGWLENSRRTTVISKKVKRFQQGNRELTSWDKLVLIALVTSLCTFVLNSTATHGCVGPYVSEFNICSKKL
jgi:predicted ABC-type sugar transport system permease subunit